MLFWNIALLKIAFDIFMEAMLSCTEHVKRVRSQKPEQQWVSSMWAFEIKESIYNTQCCAKDITGVTWSICTRCIPWVSTRVCPFIYLSMCTGSIYFLNKSLENQQNCWYINGHSTLLHQKSLELKIAQHLKDCTKRRGEEFTISVHKGSSSNWHNDQRPYKVHYIWQLQRP